VRTARPSATLELDRAEQNLRKNTTLHQDLGQVSTDDLPKNCDWEAYAMQQRTDRRQVARSMAKQTKKSKPTKARSKTPEVIIDIDPPELASPSQGDFKRVRDLLRQRSAALILDLAKRYVASKAAELTTVLDAMDSLAEFERMHRIPDGVKVTPSCAAPDHQASPSARAAMAGTVKWFNLQKGFGFIVNSSTGKDVFVHISAVEKAGLTKLNEGQQIEFELEENRGKATAVNLKVK
jgi:CspA family cold shock protein